MHKSPHWQLPTAWNFLHGNFFVSCEKEHLSPFQHPPVTKYLHNPCPGNCVNLLAGTSFKECEKGHLSPLKHFCCRKSGHVVFFFLASDGSFFPRYSLIRCYDLEFLRNWSLRTDSLAALASLLSDFSLDFLSLRDFLEELDVSGWVSLRSNLRY